MDVINQMMEKVVEDDKIKIEYQLVHNQTNQPKLANKNDECFDLYSNGKEHELEAFKPSIIGLGIRFNFPPGISARLYSRSSAPLKYSICLANCVGIIDNGYKEEVGFIALPLKDKTLPALQKIAQIEFLIEEKGRKVLIAPSQIELVDKTAQELTDYKNDRGGGFGSTDKVGE